MENEQGLLKQIIMAQSEGASRFGIHFLGELFCEWSFFMKYIVPNDDGGRGFQERGLSDNIICGKAAHVGLEYWYTSRCADPSTGELCEDRGSGDIEGAIHLATAGAQAELHKIPDQSKAELVIPTLERILPGYFENYNDEWTTKDVRVLVDESGPWVEREFTVPLDHQGYEFTSRIDLIAHGLQNAIIVEHKTSSAQSLGRTMRDLDYSHQPAGELFASKYGVETITGAPCPISPVQVVCNFLVKNSAKKPFARSYTARTDTQLRKFRTDAILALGRMEDLIGRWLSLCDEGYSVWEAARATFRQDGLANKGCYPYYSACPYLTVCQSTGYEERLVPQLQPRIRKPVLLTEPMTSSPASAK